MDVVFLIGRILFSLVFVISGIGHFQQRQGMTAIARSRGAPAPELFIPLTGAAIVASGVAIVLGVLTQIAAIVLAAFLFSTALVIHAPWKAQTAEERQQELPHFLKDLALAGAALVLLAAYAELGDEAP